MHPERIQELATVARVAETSYASALRLSPNGCAESDEVLSLAASERARACAELATLPAGSPEERRAKASVLKQNARNRMLTTEEADLLWSLVDDVLAE